MKRFRNQGGSLPSIRSTKSDTSQQPIRYQRPLQAGYAGAMNLDKVVGEVDARDVRAAFLRTRKRSRMIRSLPVFKMESLIPARHGSCPGSPTSAALI